jgi:DNA-directed RNA polymerase subunit K/omega
MRSEHVFAAAKKISNRFLLCRVTSVSARRLQMGSKQPSETISKSLGLIAASALSEERLIATDILQGQPATVFSSTVSTPAPSRHEHAIDPQFETVSAG